MTSAVTEVIEVVNPATGRAFDRVPRASVADCLAAVDAAHRAQDAWRTTAPRARAEILRRAYELMMADHERLARMITMENGKVLADARAEVAYAAEFFRWFSEEAVRIDGDLRRALKRTPADKWGAITANELMTATPIFVSSGVPAIEALTLMERNAKKAITVLPVIDDENVVGMLRMHDLIQAGLS